MRACYCLAWLKICPLPPGCRDMMAERLQATDHCLAQVAAAALGHIHPMEGRSRWERGY